MTKAKENIFIPIYFYTDEKKLKQRNRQIFFLLPQKLRNMCAITVHTVNE